MNRLLALILTLLITLLVIPSTWSRVSAQDISDWTKDQLEGFLDSNHIPYRKNDGTPALLRTVKSYKDAVVANSALFGEKVNRVMKELRLNLEKHQDVTQNRVDEILSDIQHGLRQLEIQGQLSREKVNRVLDQVKHKAVERKIATEVQWRDITNQVVSAFPSHSLYQKVFRAAPVNSDESTSVNLWLKSVADRLHYKKVYTEQQIDGAIELLRKTLSSTDISKWGDQQWINQLKQYLNNQVDLTAEQRDALLKDVEREMNGFKIFAMDYVGQQAKQMQHWRDRLVEDMKEARINAVDTIHSWLEDICCRVKQYWETFQQHGQTKEEQAYLSVKRTVQSIAEEWSSFSRATVSSARARVSNMVTNGRHSFADFWVATQRELYRQSGYTEAQISWITNYLQKAFADQKTLANSDVEQALQNIKHYLQEAQIQSEAQVRRQIDQLRHLFNTWRNEHS